MNRPVVYSLLIAGLTAALSWQGMGELARVREANAALEREAAGSSGTSPESGPKGRDVPGRRTPSTKTDVDGSEIAENLIGLLKRSPSLASIFERPPGQPSLAQLREDAAVLAELELLDSAGLTAFIARMGGEKTLSPYTAKRWQKEAIDAMGRTHPEELLKWLEGKPAVNPGLLSQPLGNMLRAAARQDPAMLEKWIQEGRLDGTADKGQNARSILAASLVGQDPARALSLLADAPKENQEVASWMLASAAHTPEERTGLIAALRQSSGNFPEETEQRMMQRFLANFAVTAVQDGFESTSKWLDSSGLSEQERVSFARSLKDNSTLGRDAGQWVDWVSRQDLPPGQQADIITGIFFQWSTADSSAASDRAMSLPPGPVRDAVFSSLIRGLARIDSARATTLYRLLPEGSARSAAREQIRGSFSNSEDSEKFERENP